MWIQKILCRIGVHKWLTVHSEREADLRHQARNAVRDEYSGVCCTGSRYIDDRFCECCGKREFRIGKRKLELIEEELKIWAVLKESRGSSEKG
jgi:hypothetical protein